MPRIRPRWWPLILVAVLLILAALAGGKRTVFAQDDRAAAADSARAALQSAIDTRQSTQEQQDAWAAARDELTARYRALQASVTWLEEQRDAEGARLVAYDERIAELERRLAESDRLQESLEDTLRCVLDRLETAVARDLPFLLEERATRLRTVRSELARPEIPAADKLRRVLEALQIETQYGGSVAVERHRIVASGDTLHADVLRLGRVALFWRTPDGRRVGTYDEAAGAWVELPGSRHRGVERAMEMAQRLRPVEVVGLPVGRVAP